MRILRLSVRGVMSEHRLLLSRRAKRKYERAPQFHQWRAKRWPRINIISVPLTADNASRGISYSGKRELDASRA